MKRAMTIMTLLTVLPLIGFAQNGITFQVEELSKPEKLLRMLPSEETYEWLILSDVNMFPFQIKDKCIDFPFNIIAKSQLPDSIVHFGYHAFFNGMYQAYADHRPFVRRVLFRSVARYDLAFNQSGICPARKCKC